MNLISKYIMTLDFLSSLSKKKGYCIYDGSRTLRSSTDNVPDAPGVYIISDHNGVIIYIGKAGTIRQDGTFKSQGLHGRLNNKQKDIARQEYFDSRMSVESIPQIRIDWYELNEGIIPGYIEGLLIQEYYHANKVLPRWNESF